MECSAIWPTRSSESAPSMSQIPTCYGAFDIVYLTGLSATPPQDIDSVKELSTPQALAMKRKKTVSALDISKYEATLEGTSKEKMCADSAKMQASTASSPRRPTPHKPREPVWTETSDNRNR